MGLDAVEHRFVERIPAALEEGILYVSIEYATAVHRCCCGCGERVVTPLTPTDWAMTFDGETVSLSPSVGNWSFECQSHYLIRKNKVVWVARWTQARIDAERIRDQAAKKRRYETHEGNHRRDGFYSPR